MEFVCFDNLLPGSPLGMQKIYFVKNVIEIFKLCETPYVKNLEAKQ